MKFQLKKELLIGLGVIAGAIVVAFGSLFWLSGDVEAEVNKISLNRSIVDQRAKSIEILAQLKTNTKNVDGYQKYMNDLLPAQEELLNFPKFIDSVARINELSASVGFQGSATPPTDTDPGYIAFILEVSGSYPSISTFFDQIESRSPKFVLVLDSVDLTRQENVFRAISHGKVFFR